MNEYGDGEGNAAVVGFIGDVRRGGYLKPGEKLEFRTIQYRLDAGRVVKRNSKTVAIGKMEGSHDETKA